MTKDQNWIRQKTQNPEMCKKCGGECCKRCGCAYFPEDLGELSYEKLVELWKKGVAVIDCMSYRDGNFYKPLPEPIYYLRAPNVNEHGKMVALKGMGPCYFLTEKGCKLSYDQRPSEGRYMVPFWSGCYTLYKEQEFIDLWNPYQDLLKSFL